MIQLSQLEIFAILGTILVSGLGFYRYFIRRPSLRFRISFTGGLDAADQALATFIVENSGHHYAEDVFLSLRLDGWRFEFVEEDIIEEAIPSDTSATWTEKPHRAMTELLEPDFVKYNIFIENTIYETVEFVIGTKIFPLDPGSTYHIDYLIACKSHRPRGGTISIDVKEDGSISTTHNHWTRYERFKYWLDSFRS